MSSAQSTSRHGRLARLLAHASCSVPYGAVRPTRKRSGSVSSYAYYDVEVQPIGCGGLLILRLNNP